MNPLLFLDVDGVLNPRGLKSHRRPEGYLTHRLNPYLVGSTTRRWQDLHRKPLRVWLDPTVGARLEALPFDLVWATTWGEEANELIGPNIGLTRTLPAVKWSDDSYYRDNDWVYYKTRDLIKWADGRDFAWVDDEIGEKDRDVLESAHPGRHLAHWIDPRHGLRTPDFDALTDWATQWGR